MATPSSNPGHVPFSSWQVLGRPVKPLVLAIGMSVFTIFWFNLVTNGDNPVSGGMGGIAGDIIGFVAGMSTMMLFFGWWWRSQRALELGLLLAAGTWIARLSTVVMLQGWGFYGTYLSLAWVVVCASEYLHECAKPHPVKTDGMSP